ncbi:MAG: hypothetical protein H7145_19010 [Akkermansiaceae bacterium]|nr:hypothetical protein [Armatimonadota bacterium]
MTQTSTHEFWVSDDIEDAVRKTKLTLKKLGDLTAVVPGQHVVGTVAFGVQSVSLKVAWRPEEIETKMDRMVSGHAVNKAKTLGTLLVVEASIEGRGTTGNDASLRNATERFEDAYMHFDRADYQPDRLGFLPITVVGIILVVALLGVLLAKKTDLFKPTPVPSPSAAAGAALIAP